MPSKKLPLLIEPEALAQQMGKAKLLIIDLSEEETYKAYHLPGAVHIRYETLTEQLPCTPGALAEDAALQQTLNAAGLTDEHHVIAYDDSDNGKACRLLWTLDLIGHSHYSLLNGGLRAWMDERHPVETECPEHPSSDTSYACSSDSPQVDLLYILQHLTDNKTTLIDARTPEEHSGEDLRASRGGHIPGAINLDHRQLLDPEHSYRLRSREQLQAAINALNINPNNEIITYCQTHRRSALVYFVLKYLGFKHLKAYPGSWAEWGNNLDTPIE